MADADNLFTALRAALAANPENLPLRLHLAGLLREHGRAADAQAEYRVARDQLEAAVRAQPASADLYEQLARVQQALGDEWGAQASLGIATALGGSGGAKASPTPEAPAPPALPPAPANPPVPERLAAGDAEDEVAAEPGLAERP